MKKHLALAAALSIFAFAGCSNISVDSSVGKSTEITDSKSMQESQSKGDVQPKNSTLSEADFQALSVNELAEVMVLMYHNIGYPESTWQRTPENFEKDLEELYNRGFRPIRLVDYANGNIEVEAGFTPVVITFDDGNENNFRYVEGEDSGLKIDPNCAVGVMERFNENHPDFNATATFFVNANPFGSGKQAKDKISFLIENGYDIGNHTLNHADLSKSDSQNTSQQLAGIVKLVNTYYPEYEVNTLALPFGGLPSKENKDAVYSGDYDGITYTNKCVLRVGWDPYKSPFHKDFDAFNIHRVRASETNVDNVGLYDWLEKYDEGKKARYVSDGDPSTIVIPEGYLESLSPDLSNKKIIKY